MLLRITYSNTKRLLKNTIQSFKSYFAGGYQRLPKHPPCNPFSCTTCSRGGAGIHTVHLTHSYREPGNTTDHHTKAAATVKETRHTKLKDPNLIIINHSEVVNLENNQEKEKMNYGKDKLENHESSKCLFTRKLKELKMMDENNMDLVLDIEEVLHYYSRLTCPVYRDIIEKFFVEMYSGTFNVTRLVN